MTPIHHKNNHFVPKVYLKRWTHKEGEKSFLFAFSNKNKILRPQETKEVARKKNLYTIPTEYGHTENKIAEKMIYKIWEDKWDEIMIKSLDKNQCPSEMELKGIKAFIVTQAFRTPRYLKATQRIIAQQNDDDLSSIDPSLLYTYQATMLWTEYMKSATIKILEAPLTSRFITSDNPASHWLMTPNSPIEIKSVAQRTDLEKNDKYKIICPISPRYMGIVTPRLGISKQKDDDKYIKIITSGEVKILNRLIMNSSDTMLFSYDPEDLIK